MSSVDGTVAWICVDVTVTGVSVVCVPFAVQNAEDPPVGSEEGIKLVPVKVRVNEALLGAVEDGEMELRTGSGFLAGLMMKAIVLERPLFMLPECGLRVFTEATPVVATKFCGTIAVSQRMLLLASS